MIIECPYCESKVDAKVLGEHRSFDPDDDPFEFKVSLVECPVCKNTLVGGQSNVLVAPKKLEWDDATRLWPQPERHPDLDLPRVVAASLVEARKCYKAGAYGACAVMCGRTLEGICAEFGTKARAPLVGGLRELLDRQIIDGRIFEWSEALREHRNIAAHASGERISKADAKDLLDFAEAICDYVFVLTRKFENFIARKKKAEESEAE